MNGRGDDPGLPQMTDTVTHTPTPATQTEHTPPQRQGHAAARLEQPRRSRADRRSLTCTAMLAAHPAGNQGKAASSCSSALFQLQVHQAQGERGEANLRGGARCPAPLLC